MLCVLLGVSLENACSFVVQKCLSLRWPDAVKHITSGLMTVELAYLLM
jgi:hypothetical protein